MKALADITWHLPLRIARFFARDPALFVRYVVVGGMSALIEFALFGLLYQVLDWPLLQANMGALSVALVFNFAAHRSWTFRVRGRFFAQLRFYAIMQGVSALLNNALVYVMIGGWGWNPQLAKAIQIALVFVWNFSFSKLMVFAERRAPR